MNKRFDQFRISRLEKIVHAYYGHISDLEYDTLRRYNRLKTLEGISANQADDDIKKIYENNAEIEKTKKKIGKLEETIAGL